MSEEVPNVGHALKSIRRAQGLSLDKTSAQTGVSKAMLGQIERGESSPTIATVWKLATGLGCSFSRLLGNSVDAAYSGSLAEPKMKVATLFAHNVQTKFEMFEITLSQFHQQLSPGHQSGVVEHIYVQEGELEILVEDIWVTIGLNQSFKLRADKPHGYRDKAGQTKFIDVIYYPDSK